MKKFNPLITVIIPNFNHAKYLKERIDSVLNQTYNNIEVFLLDDCSCDNSKEVLMSYKSSPLVKGIILNEKNSGSTFKQWKKGFELAHGEYIWIAESDDYCDIHFLEILVDKLIDDTIAIVYSKSHLVDSHDKFIKRERGKGFTRYTGIDFIRKKMGCGNEIINASAVIFNKKCLSKIPNDYNTYKAGGDYLFWIYLAEQGDVIFVHTPLNYFRQHSHKVTPNAAKTGLVFTEVIKIFSYLQDRGYLYGLNEHLAHGYFMWLISKTAFNDEQTRMSIYKIWSVKCNFPTLNKYLFLLKHCCDKLADYIQRVVFQYTSTSPN